jgi:arginase
VAASAVKHLPDVADLTTLELPHQPIYIHFDCDVLPPSELSAVSYPAEGGPPLETVEASLAHLAKTGRVAALSVTMWNPELDDVDGSAEQVVMGVIERFLEQLPDS